MKKLNKIITLFLTFSLIGCSNDLSSIVSNISSSSFSPSNEVEKIFYELKNNNFTIDYTDSIVNFKNVERNEKYYYTEYALQAEGDFGFSGIAQGKELIFKYSIDEGEVVSGAPLINSTNGTRYDTIFEYTYGLQDLDVTKLPNKLESDGYYHYTFGESTINDGIILPVVLKLSPFSFPPNELKFKIVKDVIQFEAVLLEYDLDGDGIEESKDTITSIIYDIGKTENTIIKQYLNDGKTSKDPLDLRFYKLFHPYMATKNYTVDFDATGMNYNFKMTEYCTENAILDERNNIKTGYLLNQGVVNYFSIDDEKVKIESTPTDSDYNFYTELYGQIMGYSFLDITYDVLLGFKDDKEDNVYYLTDSYLIYILSYLSYVEVYESHYCDKVKIEIINDEKFEFKAYFDFYNKQTNEDLGTYVAHFYDLNNTVIPEVNEYLSLGDNPNAQTKDNLQNVLDMFSTHNYSCDVLTSAGMAKFYNTSNYFYEELYGDPNNNFGYMKVDNSIYQFNIVDGEVILDTSKDYAAGSDSISFPSVGDYFGDRDDLGFVSTIAEGLLESSNYSINNIYNVDYWKLDDLSISRKVYNYFTMNPSNLLPTGSGVIVKDAGKDSKLTLFVSYITTDGEYYGYYTFTYYDIGYTSHQVIDSYLST